MENQQESGKANGAAKAEVGSGQIVLMCALGVILTYRLTYTLTGRIPHPFVWPLDRELLAMGWGALAFLIAFYWIVTVFKMMAGTEVTATFLQKPKAYVLFVLSLVCSVGMGVLFEILLRR